MITFYNHLHARHQGKVEMFRGALVPFSDIEQAHVALASRRKLLAGDVA